MRVIRPFACFFLSSIYCGFRFGLTSCVNESLGSTCLTWWYQWCVCPSSASSSTLFLQSLGRGWVSLSPPWLPSSCWWHLSATAFPVPQSTSAISVRLFGWRQNMLICGTVTFTFEKEFVVVVVVDRLLLKPPRRSTGRRGGNKRKLRSMFVPQNPHWFYFQFRVRLSSETINGTVCR